MITMDKSRMRRIAKCITVEPVLMLYTMSGYLMYMTAQAMIYRKVCVSHYNTTVCDNLTHPAYELEEDRTQTESSQWFLIINLTSELPSIIVSLFYGNISDHVDRKLAVMLPSIGVMFTASYYVINAAVFTLPVGAIVAGPIITGCTGGWIAFTMSIFSYISDDSSKKNRTIRIAIADGVICVSMAVSSFVGGQILDATSFTFVFSLTLAMFAVCLGYTFFCLRPPDGQGRRVQGKPIGESRGIKSVLKKVFSPQSVKNTILVVFKKRSLHRRRFIILVFGSVLLINFYLTPFQHGLSFLFVKRHPLGWSQTTYGYYRGYKLVLGSVGLFGALPLLKKKARMHETEIMIMTVVLSTVSEVVFGFSMATWMVFVGGLLSIISPCNMSCARSLLSTLVEPTELGQVLAVFGALQRIDAMLMNVVFNNLYPLTLKYWAGLLFVAGAALSVLPISILIYLRKEMKGVDAYTELEEERDNMDKDTTQMDLTLSDGANSESIPAQCNGIARAHPT